MQLKLTIVIQAVMQMVSLELQSISTSGHRPERQMRIIATGLLTLNLAFITGRKSRIGQSEKLYNDLISVSQAGLIRVLLLTRIRPRKVMAYFLLMRAHHQILCLMRSWTSMRDGRLGVG